MDNAAIAQLAVGTRAATALMLYSFGARQGEDRGVLQPDLITGLLTPGLERNVIVTALTDLREEALYLHFTGRYRFEPTPNLAKLVRDEANKYDTTEILDRIRGELDAALRGTRGVSLWPTSPDAIDDARPYFTVAYLHPDWSEHSQPLVKFVEDAAGGSPRRYRNGLALALPDGAQFDQARHNMRQHVAASALSGAHARYGFSAEQLEELGEKAATTLRNARAAIAKSYSTVCVPLRDRSGGAPFTMTPLDLRTMVTAGRSLHERVVSALEAHVFTRLTATKLVSLAGLGPDRWIVSCADLVDWFYSYFEFTKLWDRRAVAGAISEAVAASDAGYSIGLVRHTDSISLRSGSLVRIGEHLPTDEIDLSDDAALLWVDYAHESHAGKAQPTDTSTDEHGGEQKPDEQPPDPTGGKPGDGGHRPPADVIRIANVSARFDKDGFFDLQRALSWLRDKAGTASVNVEIRIHAEGEVPKADFRNGVIEPIEEKGHDVTVALS